ncbi:hypothetical protein [Clostridium botulinum]|uniref:Uncharacterized protein n=3 Tax=Clostridium botulinum TaxID=1491 RepID=A0A0A2HDL9_CLOBO|nr:hypothetical protein [Clostridium botulinum]EKN41221.1 hypothetical protein CFSAN001627_14608 [Clostridium botulinum CFSAN001627]ACO85060.1 conserved hypothetical protein [Clostridium botulinum A2 str. Kyoto]APC79725.1 hypothetical protein NPD2_3518 [Clostridium botulinum]APC83223.1 hypothetical protein NPD12_1362 [Clostridium botulinum]AUN06344.1 hypothetical protein RSJ14_06375 [Clostridium botulinum]
MSKDFDIKSKNQSAITNSENSRNSTTGYMDRGNASKIAAKQGTRNKN